MKLLINKLMRVLVTTSIVVSVFGSDNVQKKQNTTCKNHHSHKKNRYWQTVGELWIYTSLETGGKSYALLSRIRGGAFGPTQILGKQAGAQPKTAAHIAAQGYRVYTKNVDSFAVPAQRKGSHIEYRWVKMDTIFNLIQQIANDDEYTGVSIEARDGRIIALDKNFVEAWVNDFKHREDGVLFGHIDLTRPSEYPDVQEDAG